MLILIKIFDMMSIIENAFHVSIQKKEMGK